MVLFSEKSKSQMFKVGGTIEAVFDLVGFEMDPAVRWLPLLSQFILPLKLFETIFYFRHANSDINATVLLKATYTTHLTH